ncbi:MULTISPECIES: hypothetical protein [unclassified Pseudodesulfovibrio]|uniref:hypothetical protein n=1 Tax=unclassified Pseudodesulfovibrio TaxID=2661612 RepID=UPI000FEBDF43|nr:MULTISPECIES: hypothetical protein [unclassified Pseudodesulfovibrio]MCJ2164884.1 hypothetical protein [Pseudodesulfovibrio sp. S3-i]RWU03749.1 hypothetical protein DWB63_09835 [Pseudodesulfovibrio sp. S3]
MITFLKSMLFFPMMFLRGILQWILRLFAGLSLLGGIGMLIAVYGFDAKLQWYIPWIILGWSFVFFLVSWFYDIILLKLNPHPDTVLFLD